jgi:hypothetical protein
MERDPRDDIVLPPGVGTPLTPPPEIRQRINHLEELTVCGGRDGFVWEAGPHAGQAVTGWCAEPLCMDTGVCPAPRFVPHLQQSTHLDAENPLNHSRTITLSEAAAAVRIFHDRAHRRGAALDDRTDSQIASYVKRVWDKMRRSMAGPGDWRFG